MNTDAEEWISKEDSKCRNDRIARLNWLIERTPLADYWVFSGAPLSKYLFEEARYCFVYAQDIAAMVLGFSFIEFTIAAMLYGRGDNSAGKANASTILLEARNRGIISPDEYENLLEAKRIRNRLIHFIRPDDHETIEYRALENEKHPYELIEMAARNIMALMLRLADRNLV